MKNQVFFSINPNSALGFNSKITISMCLALKRQDAEDLLRILQKRLSRNDPSISGFNVGMNCGESAGQTIMHAHIHLIPRRKGDTRNPRGGVRGAIPEKMDY